MPFLLTHHKKGSGGHGDIVVLMQRLGADRSIWGWGGLHLRIYCDSLPERIPLQFGGFILRNGDDAMELDTLASLFSFSMKNSLIAV